MRILHVSQPTQAGVPNVILDLVKDQVSAGWDVHVASPADGYLGTEAMAAGATFHAWHAVRSPGPRVGAETIALGQIFRRSDPEVVHLHSAKAGLAGRLALRGGRPTIFMPHAWSFESVGGTVQRASVAWERTAARWTHLTLCVSAAEQQLGREKGCLAQNSHVVPNGVDVTRWTPRDPQQAREALGIPTQAPTAVLVGRLSHHKAQDVAVQAWEKVAQQVAGARLYLVGDGPERSTLEALAESIPGVVLVGQASPDLWFEAADVVMLPSRWEGMPLVLLEAMAAGRSVVASRVAGTMETLGEGDHLVPIGDPHALAAAVVSRLKDPGQRAVEGGRHRETVVSSFNVIDSTARIRELTLALPSTSRIETLGRA